jgi:hypothetical protein
MYRPEAKIEKIEYKRNKQTQQSKCLLPPHLRMQTNPFYKKLCSIEYQRVDKVG